MYNKRSNKKKVIDRNLVKGRIDKGEERVQERDGVKLIFSTVGVRFLYSATRKAGILSLKTEKTRILFNSNKKRWSMI
jgi:hypothetical protein